MALKVDFRYKDGSNIYFTSDSHFGHEHILKFCERPFKDVAEMDEKLIENWNNKVPKDGLVFHLGDFAWGGGHEGWKKTIEQLNGDIILIKGNHDLRNMAKTTESLFKYVTWQMVIEIEGRKIWLNHFPFLCYSGTYRDPNGLVYNLHGHVHSGPCKKGRDIPRLDYRFPTQYDVGVDNNNYTPISWHEVNEKIQEQIKKQNE